MISGLIKTINNCTPIFGDNPWVAEGSIVIGDVIAGNNCSIWFNAVIRGDVNSIIIGNNVNIQDNATIHCTYNKTKTIIGNNVSIGHNAIVHGCTIMDNVLIGMGAIVMDNVSVQSNVIVAAGAVVLESQILEANTIYAGVPAKAVKKLDPTVNHKEIKRIADNYIKYSSWFTKG
ncbi:MAG: carbonic anhydrase/acetyltransferase-like protein (isoleucine patch superfamily) [Sphingobacteriales bacterium]|jgi:carbonic anhydrase/acetyltransferase-like protein (isoleucine patch superfamily)